MSFSIVVVTWESGPDLSRLVASMNAHLAGDEELIVVDNDSTEVPLEIASGWKGEGRLLELDANHGFGAAANAGVAVARQEAVVVMNADTELLDDRLGELAALAAAEGVLAGPRVLDPDGSLQPSASGPPVGVWPWVEALVPAALLPKAALARTSPWRLGRRTPVAWLTGCCVAGPALALRSLGPFDPSIHLYAEDLDLGLRASASGVGSLYVPAPCSVRHYGKGSTSQRFEDLGRGPSARNGRAVLARAFGARRERRAYAAARANLTLRVTAKRLLRRDRSRDEAHLLALRGAAGPVPEREAADRAKPVVRAEHRLGPEAII